MIPLDDFVFNLQTLRTDGSGRHGFYCVDVYASTSDVTDKVQQAFLTLAVVVKWSIWV
jgi:hypothetical protein